jgi:hypothetical protein
VIFGNPRAFPALTWGLLAIGGVLRVIRYADNRSFWLDEALFGLNIIDRSASELKHALDYVQSAPYGFLLAEKASVELLGAAEPTLRLVPLLSSLGGLVLFGVVVQRLLDPAPAALAAALFALGEPLIYQASEAKPYTSDVLAALAIVLVALRVEDQRSPRPYAAWLVGFGAVGVAAVWISYPAAFVLAGAGVALALRAALERALWKLPALGALAAAWLAGFAASYATSSGTIASVQEKVFTDAPSVRSHVGETIHLAWYSFSDPAGFYPPLRLVAVLCLALGLVAFAREGWDRLVLVAAPGALAVAASLLSKYPLGGRFVLFLAPLGFLAIARGAQFLYERTGRSLVVAGALVVALTGAQAVWSAERVVDPPRPENMRPLLESLADDWRPTDALYVYRNAQYVLRWYAECEDCGVRPLPFAVRLAGPRDDDGIGGQAALLSSPPTVVVGRGDADDASIARLVDSFAGRPRVWFLFSHAASLHGAGGLNDEQRFLRAMDTAGRRVVTRRESGASLYLVDFSAAP